MRLTRAIACLRAVVWGMLLCACVARADTGIALAVSGAGDTFQTRFGEALSASLQEKGERHHWRAPARSELLIALGDDAFRGALMLQRPVLGVFVSRQVALDAYASGCACSAFFQEADPVRQLRLARLLFPGARRIALVTSPQSAWNAGLLLAHAEAHDLLIEHHTAVNAGDLARGLPRWLAQADLLLAVHDPELYSPETARLVLLTSYRQNKPVIGPDEFFVQAGSVASSYTSGADMVDQVADAVARFRKRGRLPPPDFSDHISVRLNEHVARTYEVPLQDPGSLAQQLMRQSTQAPSTQERGETPR
ncbi:hypothetical protein K8B33_10450 [Alcanivorax sp. JB21]|uniref:ABC transporter substrate-binding protein n=1 Tax=Alcanivorax limicola TaxID=2874102 RepID=UPI001CBB9959|nr:hypothetical protein [Alcanivorax limicola]MBZ2189517.1 hypothetical protein [Alcanivorax limicola]